MKGVFSPSAALKLQASFQGCLNFQFPANLKPMVGFDCWLLDFQAK